MDEHTVAAARSSVRNQMLVVMVVACAVFTGVGWTAGGASEKSASAVKSRQDAGALAEEVKKARDSLVALADKLDAGRNSLVKDKKFPQDLSKELGGMTIDFDGTKLAGRRFSGMSKEATQMLLDFISSVNGVNDRRKFVQALLARLQKPITDQLQAAAKNAPLPVQWVVVFEKETVASGAFLTPLATPFIATTSTPNLPPKLTVVNIRGSGNVEVPRYAGGNFPDKGAAAVPVIPATFDAACPSETRGQIAQLGQQILSLKAEIQKDRNDARTDIVEDTKADLVERADKLIAELQKASGT
jgi:hypothetical protein